MLFPLGCSCKLRKSIERFTNEKRDTNLFDWVLTNFDTILYYVENIDEKIKSDDFYDSNILINENKIVNHKKIRFSSVHDFPLSLNYEDNMKKFIDTLNRRLKRFKSTILNSKNIDFIHTLDIENEYNFHYNPEFRESNIYIPTSNSVDKFINLIKNLNSKLIFTLHILIPPNSDNYHDLIKPLENINNVNVHYLTKDDSIEQFMYKFRNWSWNDVYTKICNKPPINFNVSTYKKMNEDLINMTDDEAIEHYIKHGVYENRKYIDNNALPLHFNVSIYKKINEDLMNMTDDDAINHYLKYGIYENRKYIDKNNLPSDFNVSIYKKINDDLIILTDDQAIDHYINRGIYENRKYKNNVPSNFNVSTYKSINKDLINMTDDEAIEHYIKYGIYENRKII